MGHPFPPPPGHPGHHGQPPFGHQGPPGQPPYQPPHPQGPPGYSGAPGPNPPPPGPPPGHPPQGAPGQPSGRRPRTALTVALSAAVTLAVAGSLTWVVSSAYGSSTGPARGLPTGDPCAAVGEQTLADMNGEVRAWNSSVYANSCSWWVSLAGEDEVLLSLVRYVPLSAADAELSEERGPDTEALPTTSEELFSTRVEDAAEVGFTVPGIEVVETRDRPLSHGDEGTLVVTDIDYGSGEPYNQKVTLVVREGDLVTDVSFRVFPATGEIDLNTAEDLLDGVAADVFG